MLDTAQSTDKCRTTDRDFKKNFVASFGEALREKCWTANEVNIARLARHALTHAGGRINDKFAKQNHAFIVREGRIQVTPEKTKALFSLLKNCVYSLAEQAVTMSKFE